jgi:hypothetical protein
LTVDNVNRAPDLAIQVPDLEFDEDGPEQQVGVLTDIFVDEDGDQMLFTVSENENILRRIENDVVFVQPALNWFGETEIILTADDQQGGVTTDTLQILVNSINDLPTAFTLLRPSGIDTLASLIAVKFVWEESIDIVEESPVTYELLVSIDGELVHHIVDIADTTRRIAREDLSINPDGGTLIEWYVLANDGTDNLRSIETFEFWLRPMDVEEDPNRLVPTELTLGPIYPNPFNDQVTVQYGLPVVGDAVITIHDHLGREVKRFYRDGMAPGYFAIVWDGRNSRGMKVASGMYIARIATADKVRMQRLVLMR